MSGLTTKQAIEQVALRLTAEGAVPVSLADSTVAALAGTGAAAKSLADVTGAVANAVDSLEELIEAVDAQRRAIAGTNEAAKSLPDLFALLESAAGVGLPTMGVDAGGQDGYAAILAAPNRVCRHLFVAVGANGAVISLDGGTTDHLSVPANTSWCFSGLAIPALASIRAKNLDAGSNYAGLRISVW
jgi:hypothetical protein